MSKLLASLNANVVSVFYDKASEGSNITDCVLRINIETRDADHIREVHQALAENGFSLLD